MKKQKQLKKQEYKILLVEDGSVDVDALKCLSTNTISKSKL